MMKGFFNGLVSARMMELDNGRSFSKARKQSALLSKR